MLRTAGSLLLLLTLAACVHAPTPPITPSAFPEDGAYVLLGGDKLKVTWTDGDSFKFREGPYKGKGVRMTGYNTLESYGPVHRWGDWSAMELFEIARTSKYVAAAQVWECTTNGELDSYNRVLVSCPGVVEATIAAGHAHVFAMEAGDVDEAMLAVQRTAMKRKWGMWAKGTPDVLVTSLHSAAENDNGTAYNRTVDLATGVSTVRQHQDVYETCAEICEGPPNSGSCMTYVPFKKRYKGKPDCLRY
ncbi:MAG: nuclease [Proteobacteria bacterium]|nr:nuclease [Pseudomonadota bacterium]